MRQSSEGGFQPAVAASLGSFQQAAATLADASFCASGRYRDQQLRADRDGAHKSILTFSNKLVKELAARDVPFFAHVYYRGREAQEAAKSQGNSKASFGKSPHNFGCAVDLIHGVRAWKLSEKEWQLVGAIGKDVARRANLKIVWGGDWKFYDPAHWELRDWREVRKCYNDLSASHAGWWTATQPERLRLAQDLAETITAPRRRS